MVATSDQPVVLICCLFCHFLQCLIFGAKSVESPFQNESNPQITFVFDPINEVVESGIENESRHTNYNFC